MNLGSEEITFLFLQLEGTFELDNDGENHMFTAPCSYGAFEVDSWGQTWFRAWDRTHGLSQEEELELIPDIPITEVPSWLRMQLKKQEYIHDLRGGCTDSVIYRACGMAFFKDEEISHNVARAVGFWNGDDDSPDVQAFQRDGSITSYDLWWNYFSFSNERDHCFYPSLSEEWKLIADMFGTYLVKRRLSGDTGPVEGWSDLKL